MAKSRLDKLILKRGLAPDIDRARALILAGSVKVNGITVSKAGSQVDQGADVSLKAAPHPYVSRGALKLEKALDAFEIDPSGFIAMDVGASTGGFTDLLLKRGAAKVYAIDVGYGQLAWSLRQDDRVVVLERENVRHLGTDKVPDAIDLSVIDVSFISLRKILMKVAALMKTPHAPIVALIKPQFEAERDEVGEGGVVRDPEIRQACIDRVRDWCSEQGFEVGEVVESPIKGPAGNVEFLVLLRTPASLPEPDAES